MIYPMFSLVIFTFIVGLIAITNRFLSVASGTVKIKYYRLMQGEDAPEIIIKTTRCFNNLFEVPILFYVVCSLYISLNIHSAFGLVLAWLFVVFRFMQAIIHLTYNNVVHRMIPFVSSFVCVLGLWVNLVLFQI